MNQVTLKVIAALLAGCTMVLKPSEEAPLNALLFAEILEAAGCPPGVFNLVNGDGVGVGSQLTSHPDVDAISFTGSSRAGKHISKAAADDLKRVSLELGGKGANLVFDDAPEGAIKAGVLRCMNNSGQSCNAPARMLVQRSIYDRAIRIAEDAAAGIRIGHSENSETKMGPVVNKAQFDKVQGYIQRGIDEGATLVAGGIGRPNDLNRGYFVRPTVFADVTNDMTIAREEIFGPVLSMMPFETEEQAISIANDTQFGLTNYVQTSDVNRARRVAGELRSGMVEMNGQSRGPGAPFGGVKQSGYGREGGRWGIEEFLDVKSVSGWDDVT